MVELNTGELHKERIEKALHNKKTLTSFAEKQGYRWRWWQDLIDIAKEHITEFEEFVLNETK